LQFLSLVSNPMDAGLVDRNQLLRDIAQSMDIDPDEIVKSEEQLALEQQQQAALQAQMQQGAIASGNEALNEPRMAPPQGAF
jgi:hypothetical protein